MPFEQQFFLEVGSEFEQVFAKFLPLGALSFEVGFAGRIGAFEFAFIGEVELTAQGNKETLYVIAFFGFS